MQNECGLAIEVAKSSLAAAGDGMCQQGVDAGVRCGVDEQSGVVSRSDFHQLPRQFKLSRV